MLTIEGFLDTVRQNVSRKDIPKIIVTGNDSADLDSIISSLLFAYLSYLNDTSTLYLPLIKVPRDDLELRPELKYVFEETQLDYHQLICIDDLDWDALTCPRIVLVDHNHLTAPFHTPVWHDRVVGVLDHHVDEKLYLDAPLRVVEMVGSCVTLVLEQFPEEAWIHHTQVTQLALAPLLVDTVNLKWELGRTTEKDVALFEKLKTRQAGLIDNQYFKAIEHVKSKVDTMSSYHILRRDYKEFIVKGYRIGTSAVTWYFHAWAERDSPQEIEQAAKKYTQERQLDMEVIFTAFDHDKEGAGDYKRQLAVMVCDPKLKVVQEALETTDQVQLTRIDALQTDSLTFYDQGNVRMSRKQVWPLVKELIESKL
ncbi:uncharacterized protein B0P05DRAFT_541897 [Gilbertella persicaria]|uniref:Exopolyphosphatase n=1 Tax=Rhizopus stolonifer TaxID=4846 RepID=A0A367KWV4_RHIST|nr:uncharacterized protein B0P05DRAFT_541897 [Gilbertella persicaria]KAI8078969.1 hypothetical protein B0P05DRAFT_541897 [Gilbertella persicaria]RCI06698.1 Exopolyphosphatase [Rhizopus stolonifer]